MLPTAYTRCASAEHRTVGSILQDGVWAWLTLQLAFKTPKPTVGFICESLSNIAALFKSDGLRGRKVGIKNSQDNPEMKLS